MVELKKENKLGNSQFNLALFSWVAYGKWI